MSSLENALRNALAKGNSDDPVFRRKVYEAAASAMHRSLEAKGNMPKEAFDQQKLRLADAIRKLEAEIKAVSTDISVRPDEPTNEVQSPSVSEEVKPEPPVENSRLYVEPRSETVPPENPKAVVEEPRHRAPFAKMLTGAVAIALLGIGLLWIITTGAFQSEEERDTSVPNPEKVLESESFEGRDPGTATAPETLRTRAGNADGWLTLFEPADPTTLGLVGGATASIESDSFGEFAKLVTPAGNAEVQVDIPLGVMNGAAGKTLQVSLIARSDEGKPTQMSVTCDFGDVSICGRVRYSVGQAENEYLFQVPIPSDGQAPAQGILKIRTDVENKGRALKLLFARARLVDN